MICPKCQIDKPLTEYYATKSHKGSWCKECLRAACRKWATENPEKARAAKKNYNSTNAERVRIQNNARVTKFNSLNPEKRQANLKKWKAKNPEKVSAASKRTRERQIMELRDSYIKNMLRVADPPPALIELQRVSIQIKRIIRERK